MSENWLCKLKKDISGATSIEYGLIVAGICIAVVTVLYTLGDQINAVFAYLGELISSKTP